MKLKEFCYIKNFMDKLVVSPAAVSVLFLPVALPAPDDVSSAAGRHGHQCNPGRARVRPNFRYI
jgi:hypothetical protein